MSIKACLDKAAAMNVITREEAEKLKARYDEIAADTINTAEARARMVRELEAEAAHRERAALLTDIARTRLLDTIGGYRNLRGEIDYGEAFISMHENMGRRGSFVQDVKNREDVIARQAHSKLKQIMKAFRRGAIVGDLRRTSATVGNKQVQARMDNFVRELFGESSNDPTAKAMAKAWSETAEDLRVRFNAGGGAIAKLEGWGLPQSHNALALLDFGKEPWIEHMMGADVLDRAKTVHPVTREPMTDAEMRRSLGVVWDRITTDGWSDRDVTASAGKGAIYTQHADHRFLHFKSADGWLAYQKQFGSGDVFATMMGHVGVMARDIAAMEVFGPNPNAMREYLKNWVNSKAAQQKSSTVVISGMVQRIEELEASVGVEDARYRPLVEELSRTMNKIAIVEGFANLDLQTQMAVRRHIGKLMKWYNEQRINRRDGIAHDELKPRLPFEHEHWALIDDLLIQQSKIFDELAMLPDPALREQVAPQIEAIWADMPDLVAAAEGVRADMARDYIKGKLKRADVMWQQMRGEEPENLRVAERMQSLRNFVTSASLGSAALSALTDVGFGQDTRLRLGMGFVKSNFARLAIGTAQEMISMGTREDAIAAGLGFDSAMNVLRKSATEVKGWDHKFWTGYLADRTLTWGMLQPWTQAGKHMFGFDFMRNMGKIAKSDWAALDPRMQKALTTHGFNAATWEQIRTAPLHEGAFLRANEIEAHIDGDGIEGRVLAERYLQMILRETRYAVPEGTVRSRSIIQATPAGTVTGELIRSMGQFKGFGFAVVFLHAARIAREIGAGDVRNPLLYGGALLITGTFLGAIAMAMKDVKDGRDPRKWLDEKTYLDPKTMGAAFLQAGGLGIYGDFLFSETSRFGGGLESTLAGPVVGRAGDIIELTAGSAARAMKGEKTGISKSAMKVAAGSVPVVGNPVTSLAFKRLVLDQIQRLIDPDAQKAFNKAVQTRQKDFKQDHWWRPGTTSPQRAPDMSRPLSTR